MKSQIFLGVAALVIFCATLTSSQWTPDPFCPYPSEEVTRYPYYGNCSVWWECFEGAKYPMECPEGLEFNAALEQCDDPSIANCDPFASTTGNPDHTTSSNTQRTTPSDGGPDCSGVGETPVYYPYEGDCSRYWECWRGEGYVFSCPGGLWWNPVNTQCSEPGDFCTQGTTAISSTTTQVDLPDCTGTTDSVYYPYEGDCTRYWECADGELYLQSCPADLWWHQSIGSCDNPGSYCDNSSTGSTLSPTTSNGQPDCFGVEGPEYYPFESDCSRYWECASGELYLQSCPEGLWWHQSIEECDNPGSYCNNSNIVSTNPPIPTDEEMCTGGPNDLPFYPYPTDCTMYWECSDGFLYLYTCPGGGWWNQANSQCESPGEFCADYTTPSISPTTVFQCSANGTSYWPDPTACHIYIECIDGTAYQVECPPDLYYSESQELCVAKEESECCAEKIC